ncbi:DUF1223 domain-containing protein [Terasakiella sp. A23]|uniref:DUF1223 domain-containing protein n=1 Tax=Terasakiella sp. FCG-A23 TaxID=3080561 RepID=UPI0029536DCA|nr:DUF1223 domain-containing protein [Terasakiella sp. A23]MDV7339953.1 DUF1223 domain-containing protein [Terasakiella sp. A23]
MKKITFILLVSLLLLPLSAKANQRLAVVELFTSQGCSSCPPADAFLGELSMRNDVLALAFHVDYWDYIGWKDIHASPEYTQRQRNYASAFNLRYVYTPQMVVAGDYETSGNSRRNVVRAIEKELSKASDLDIRAADGVIAVSGPAQNQNIHVYRVSFIKEEKTKVRRGENRGKTLTDYNIVSDLVHVGNWRGGDQTFTYDVADLDPNHGHAIFLQRANDLKILTAIRLTN